MFIPIRGEILQGAIKNFNIVIEQHNDTNYIVIERKALESFFQKVIDNYFLVLTSNKEMTKKEVIKWLYQYRINTYDPSNFILTANKLYLEKTPEEILAISKEKTSKSIFRESTLSILKDAILHNGFSTLKEEYITKPYTVDMLKGTVGALYELFSSLIAEIWCDKFDSYFVGINGEITNEDVDKIIKEATEIAYRTVADLITDDNVGDFDNFIYVEAEPVALKFGISYLQYIFQYGDLRYGAADWNLHVILTALFQVGCTVDILNEIADTVNMKSIDAVKKEKERIAQSNTQLDEEAEAMNRDLTTNLKPFMCQMFANGMKLNPDAMSLKDIEELKDLLIKIRKEARAAKGLPEDSNIIV